MAGRGRVNRIIKTMVATNKIVRGRVNRARMGKQGEDKPRPYYDDKDV